MREVAASGGRRRDGKVLLLKRSLTHTTNPGKWCFVTGYLEPGETGRDAAVRELREEVGIDAAPLRAGRTVEVVMDWALLYVHPFLFECDDDVEVRLDREHSAFVWIDPQEIYQYDFVQQLDEDLAALGLLK